MSSLNSVIVNKLAYQIITSEFDSHWVLLTSDFILYTVLCLLFNKLLFDWHTNLKLFPVPIGRQLSTSNVFSISIAA